MLINEKINRISTIADESKNVIRECHQITNSKSAELKEKNPKDRFNKFIYELEESLRSLEANVKDINSSADSIIKNFKKVKENVQRNIRRRARSIIRDNMNEASAKLSDSGETVSGDSIADIIIEKVNAVIKEECNRGFQELVPDISRKLQNNTIRRGNLSVSDLSTQKVRREYEVDIVERIRKPRKAFGKIFNLVLGEKYETKNKKVTKEQEFDLGDNSAEVEKELMDYFDNVGLSTLEKMIDDITNGCVKPLKAIYKETNVLINNTKVELEGLKIK